MDDLLLYEDRIPVYEKNLKGVARSIKVFYSYAPGIDTYVLIKEEVAPGRWEVLPKGLFNKTDMLLENLIERTYKKEIDEYRRQIYDYHQRPKMDKDLPEVSS